MFNVHESPKVFVGNLSMNSFVQLSLKFVMTVKSWPVTQTLRLLVHYFKFCCRFL